MASGSTNRPFGAFDPNAAAKALYPAGYGDLPIDADVDGGAPKHPLTLTYLLVVALGGGLGTLARYGAGEAFVTPRGGFPSTLLVINTLGAFAIGIVVLCFSRRLPHFHHTRLFLGTGILGGWTTYSAVIGSILVLGHGRHLALAGLFVVASFVLGLLAALLGIVIGGRLWPRTVVIT